MLFARLKEELPRDLPAFATNAQQLTKDLFAKQLLDGFFKFLFEQFVVFARSGTVKT
jgi:hypothetical protein